MINGLPRLTIRMTRAPFENLPAPAAIPALLVTMKIIYMRGRMAMCIAGMPTVGTITRTASGTPLKNPLPGSHPNARIESISVAPRALPSTGINSRINEATVPKSLRVRFHRSWTAITLPGNMGNASSINPVPGKIEGKSIGRQTHRSRIEMGRSVGFENGTATMMSPADS